MITNSRKITAATDLLVPVAEIKLHARIDGDIEDGLIESYIKTETENLELHTGRKYGLQTWAIDLNAWSYCIQLPFPQVQSVESIEYYDADDTLQSFEDFSVLLPSRGYATIHVRPGVTLPVIADRPDAIQITYTVGDVPEAAKHAVRLVASQYYRDREAEVSFSTKLTTTGLERLTNTLMIPNYGQ